MEKYFYDRNLMDKITPWLFQGKVIILYGPRQVGKTTFVNKIISLNHDSLYLNCERQNVWELLGSLNIERIRAYIGKNKLVVFDEAQKVAKIGQVLKLLIDTFPEIQYIATGSSSFELSNEVSEPLTGRNIKFIMYPLSLAELSQNYNAVQMDEKLEDILLFGAYPDIIDRFEDQKLTLLDELTSDYLFRDVLRFENIKRSDVLVSLLKALALQLGSEVSLRELSNLLKISVETIQKYIQLLEKSFVLLSLISFSRNLRNEIARSKKYYFYDLGIRNSLLQNFNSLQNRDDTGALWENFCIIERMKFHQVKNHKVNMYFWRTYQQKEIDLVEEYSGKLFAFEMKWKEKKTRPPKEFIETYKDVEFNIINRENYLEFLL